MTNAQFTARKLLKKHQQYLTSQQFKTLNGLIKAGNIEGALNGLHTIMARSLHERRDANGADRKAAKGDKPKTLREFVRDPVHGDRDMRSA